MKRILLILWLVPVLAFSQLTVGGGGVQLDDMLPVIADSSDVLRAEWLESIADSNKWTDGSTVHAIKPKAGKTVEADSVKAGALEVTGNARFNSNVTMITTAGEQFQLGTGSDAAPELSSAGDTNTGIRFPGSDVTTFVQGGTKKAQIDASNVTVSSGIGVKVGTVQWDMAAKDSLNGASIGARTIPHLALPVLAGDVTGTTGVTVVGDDSHNHTTAATKFVIADSQRVNKTSKLIGNVEIGTGTGWFTAEDSHLAVVGDISLDGFKVSKIDTVFTATYVPRWVKYTSGAKSWYCPVYADTTGKW